MEFIMFKFLKNQVGASMVQVMIAAGMIGGLSLVLSELMKQQAKTKRTAELDTEINMITDLIRKAINNKEMCDASFAGVGLGDNIEGIRLSQTSDQYFCKAREKFKASKIYISSLRLLTKEEQADIQSNFFINEAGTSEVVVEILMEKQGDGYGGKHIKKRFHFPAKFGEGEQIDVKLLGSDQSDFENAVTELQTMCLEKRENGDSDWSNVKDINVSSIASQLKNSAVGEELKGNPFYKAFPDTIMLECIVANPESLIKECI
jgi:hypothetical protein